VGAVDAVCLGNEIIQKGIADHDRLVREVGQARERFGRPVTTGFQPPDWQLFPDLATTVGDFTFLNVHPWWVLHRNDPLTAATWVAEAYQLVAGTPGMPAGRTVVVQETSFPSGAVAPQATPGATPENQRRFYQALVATDVPFVWFHAVDSPMYRTVSPPGGFGGLWDENWQPKPVAALLSSALDP
jgi:exo-beta-1,3-glucanase (GH17 family)